MIRADMLMGRTVRGRMAGIPLRRLVVLSSLQ